jgi:hypothetical protein
MDGADTPIPADCDSSCQEAEPDLALTQIRGRLTKWPSVVSSWGKQQCSSEEKIGYTTSHKLINLLMARQ